MIKCSFNLIVLNPHSAGIDFRTKYIYDEFKLEKKPLAFEVFIKNFSVLTLYPPNYSIGIFTHLKLCLADAIHNFK